MLKIILYITLLIFTAPSALAESFPENTFYPEKPSANDFVEEWYSKHLKALEEKALWKMREDKNLHLYRFLSLPAWGNPTAITFSIGEDGSGSLIVKKTDGQGGYEPGKLILNKTIKLSQAQTDELLKRFEKPKFWSLPTRIDRMGLDGTQWIIEGLKEGNYHIVDRWTPEEGEFVDTCLLMFKFAGIELN